MTIQRPAKLLLLAALSSCIDVKSSPGDAGNQPGQLGECVDGLRVVDVRTPPIWLYPGPFAIDTATVGVMPPTWRASGKVPDTASFAVPFQAGDTLVRIGWDAHGGSTNKGLSDVRVYYQAPIIAKKGGPGRFVQVATGSDVDRHPEWGFYEPARKDFHPAQLERDGVLWVSLGVEDDYRIGFVTATFARPCI